MYHIYIYVSVIFVLVYWGVCSLFIVAVLCCIYLFPEFIHSDEDWNLAYINNSIYVMIHILYYICILYIYITSYFHKLHTGSFWSVGLRLLSYCAYPSSISPWWHPIVFIFAWPQTNLSSRIVYCCIVNFSVPIQSHLFRVFCTMGIVV